MAKRITLEGNYFMLEDTISNILEIEHLSRLINYKQSDNKIYFYFGGAIDDINRVGDINGYTSNQFVDGNNSDATFIDLNAVITSLRDKTGKE